MFVVDAARYAGFRSARDLDRPCSSSCPRSQLSTPLLDCPAISSLRALTRFMSTRDRAIDHDAVLAGAPRQLRGVGARHQRLRGNATGVDASAAEALRSTMATFMPAPERRAASAGPACPVPITIASNCLFMDRSLSVWSTDRQSHRRFSLSSNDFIVSATE